MVVGVTHGGVLWWLSAAFIWVELMKDKNVQ
jgi:hypothetical protein